MKAIDLMAIFYGTNEYVPDDKGTCVALGFFDGVHLGHRAVIGNGVGCGLRNTALTFRESPTKALGRECPPLLTDNDRKAALMTGAGADDVIFADFTELKDLGCEDFVRRILIEKLNAKRVCCGFNYRFGKGGAGGAQELERLCERYGISVTEIKPVTVDGERVSSSRIRGLITSGEIEKANAMLGSAYAICGEIKGGNHLGSELGYPTINIPVGDGLVVPKYGVYGSKVTVGGEVYTGATNIGVHPTAGANDKPLCETFLPDYRGGSLYGKTAVCELMAFIREERLFDSMEALKKQIAEDCKKIKEIM